VSVEELIDRLRSEADDLGAFGRDTECTTVTIAADLIAALMAEREAWRHWHDDEHTSDGAMMESTSNVDKARNRVDEIIGRIGK
jgi:hypothetical protein